MKLPLTNKIKLFLDEIFLKNQPIISNYIQKTGDQSLFLTGLGWNFLNFCELFTPLLIKGRGLIKLTEIRAIHFCYMGRLPGFMPCRRRCGVYKFKRLLLLTSTTF